MSSVAEAKYGSCFHRGQKEAPMRVTLNEMGYPQPAAPIKVEHLCATGIAKNEIKQKRSKAMDMRFHWIRNIINQGHYIVYWRPGYTNKSDYYTKHHPRAHHRYVKYDYIHKANAIIYQIKNMVSLRGFINFPIIQQKNQMLTVK